MVDSLYIFTAIIVLKSWEFSIQSRAGGIHNPETMGMSIIFESWTCLCAQKLTVFDNSGSPKNPTEALASLPPVCHCWGRIFLDKV